MFTDMIRKKPRTRKDYLLLVIILIAILVFAIAVSPIVFSLKASGHYRQFTDAYTDAMNASHARDRISITTDGESFQVPISAASEIYNKILYAGMGKEQKKQPGEAAVIIEFLDGSRIEFQESAIPESSAIRDTGLFIRFIGSDGFIYQYDTDKLTLEHVLKELPVNSE